MNHISVPVVKYKKITIPAVVTQLLKDRFTAGKVKLFVGTDFDDTLVPTPTDLSKRSTLDRELIEPPLLGILRNNIPIVVITGSRQEEIEARLVNPLKEILKRGSELNLMRRFQVYPNGGALRLYFDENGQLDKAGFEKYKQTFTIPKKDEKVLAKVLEDAGFNYWERYQEARAAMRSEYPLFIFKTPEIANQGGVKLTLSPLPQGERALALKFITQELEKLGRKDLLWSYQIEPGGKSTINVLNKQINKGFAMRDAMRQAGIPEKEQYPIVYFGDGFYVRCNDYGDPYKGDDMTLLDISNTVLIGVNNQQEDLRGIPKVIPGGSGPEATLAWLTHFNHQLSPKE